MSCQAWVEGSQAHLANGPPAKGSAKRGVLGGRHSAPSKVEGIKEQELLEALGRTGKLTAVEASLESSLSVEEANRMLFDLAARGHLELTVEHGRLVYSFWGARSMRTLLWAVAVLALEVLLLWGYFGVTGMGRMASTTVALALLVGNVSVMVWLGFVSGFGQTLKSCWSLC